MRKLKTLTALGASILGLVSVASCSITRKNNNNNDTEQVVVTGDYVVTYYVNGNVYKQIGVNSGDSLTLIDTPEIEGYDVSWENVDLTNITSNITINAVLTAKTYTITYELTDTSGNTSVYGTETYKYNDEVTGLTVSVPEGYVFSGWSNLPSTMGSSNITVSGSFIEISNTYDISLYSSGTQIDISKSGAYTITGTNENVSFNVTAEDVTLVLDSVSSTSLETSFITSTNAISINTTGSNILSNNSNDITDGVISSTGKLTLGGSGTLEIVTSNASGAGLFTSNAELAITAGTIEINAAGNGIQAKKSNGLVSISGGSLSIVSADHSIKSKTSVLVSSGTLNLTSTTGDGINADTVDITNGTITIVSKGDGIQGDSAVEISGGTFNITTNGGKTGNQALTTSSSWIFEEEDTSSFTTDDEYLGLYYLNGQTYVKVTDDNVSSVKSKTLYNKVGCKGIKSDLLVNITGGTIVIDSLDDAISSNDVVTINGGNITIDSQGDGVSSDNTVNIKNGTLNITTTGSWYSQSGGAYTKSGTTYKRSDSGSYDLYNSNKGINSESNINISGGTIITNCVDDAIHSDEYVYVTAGTMNLTTLDDGIHADTTLEIGISGNSNSLIDINVISSYEGLEAGTINIISGTMNIYGLDDGINAGGGSDSSTGGDTFNPGGQRPGQSSGTTTSTSSYSINVSGGILVVSVASGDTDAVDSNGTYKQTGGVVVSQNASSSGTATSLDTDGSATITGGIFVGLGKLETTPSVSGVTKKSVSVSLSSGKTYSLVESSNTLASWTMKISYSSITFIAPSGTYSITSGSSTVTSISI